MKKLQDDNLDTHPGEIYSEEKELVVKYNSTSGHMSVGYNFTVVELLHVLDLVKADAMKEAQKNIIRLATPSFRKS